MTRLGSVRTRVGVVTLHHRGGAFWTRMVWMDDAGRMHKQPKVPQLPSSARCWYAHMKDCGHVRREFPVEVEA